MPVRKTEVTESKEMAEVWDAVVHVVSELKAGKSLAEVGASSVPKLLTAIDGVGGVVGEAQEDLQSFIQANLNGAAKVGGLWLQKSE